MERKKLIEWVIVLSIFTIIYNLGEGAISIYLGLADEAVALFGFGVDSLIEAASAGLVIWRFRKEVDSMKDELQREKIANLGIGILYIMLTATIFLTSVWQLMTKTHPINTFAGIVISVVSILIMLVLWQLKLKIAEELQSQIVKNDAGCTLACIKLSVVLFFGSFLFFYFPSLWWVDSVSAMVLSYFIGQEGLEIIRSRKDDGSSHANHHH